MDIRARAFDFKERIDYAKMYVNIIESMSPNKKLSPREVDVVAAFASIDDEWSEGARFTTAYRMYVKEKLGMSDSQMSTILRGLQEMGVIGETKLGIKYLQPVYIPPRGGVQINLTLGLNEGDGKKGEQFKDNPIQAEALHTDS